MRTTRVLSDASRLPDAWLTVEDGARIVIPASFGNHFRVKLTANAVLEPPHDPHSGQQIILRIEEDTTGGWTLTPNAAGISTRGSLLLNTAAGAVSVWMLLYDDETKLWDAVGVPDLSGLYDPLGTATAAVAAHVAASDPHPQYLTAAEGDAAYLPLHGTADKATILATARAINGVNFDGSAPITVTAAAGTLSGTTLAAAVVTSSLTAVGTIATGTWQATVVGPTYGGTGVNNGSKTITLGGNVTTSGSFNLTLTLTADTSLTLPTTGTLVTLAGSGVLTTKTYQGGNFGTDAGSTDDYAITLTPAPTAYVAGMAILFVAATINTGAATLNVNSLGAKAIIKRATSTLANGDIVANMRCFVVYDGTSFILVNPVVN